MRRSHAAELRVSQSTTSDVPPWVTRYRTSRPGVPGVKYNPASDAKAWKSMLDLFGETLERP